MSRGNQDPQETHRSAVYYRQKSDFLILPEKSDEEDSSRGDHHPKSKSRERHLSREITS
jgi:hypothetical protein